MKHRKYFGKMYHSSDGLLHLWAQKGFAPAIPGIPGPFTAHAENRAGAIISK
jgi:hypothetical protein